MRLPDLPLLFVAAAALTACSSTPPAPSSVQPVPASQVVLATPPAPELLSAALTDWARDQQWEAPEREHEIQRLTALPQADARTRLRLAHLWYLQGDAQARAQARLVLSALARSGGADAAALAPLVALLQESWNSQGALDEKVEALNQQLHDANARADALGNKIQELKAIERSLVSRPVPDTPAPATPPTAPLKH
ncbi:MAG: hypothetical protein KGL17_07110 [Betaproteobacteria bacterium]|nr:hypothetical protein [Betaproteobacteria bacterium]MDE2212603.1 hypothetical protein [Betaproteobacteria bacterium]MDE2354776.1 hypothetical protein [Betaproteobacteria bacterium]